MPILPILYAVSLGVCMGIGYFLGWSGEYDEVVKLQSDIEKIHQESAKLQHDAILFVKRNKQQQQDTILELEKRYHDQITTNDSLHDQLITAQRMHRAASNTTSGCNVLPKTGNSARSQKDDVGRRQNWTVDTAGFSERFDSFVSGKARDADKIDADRRLLLDWVKTIPKDLIQ